METINRRILKRKYFKTASLPEDVILMVEVIEGFGGIDFIQGDEVWCKGVRANNRRVTVPAYHNFYKKSLLIAIK